MSGSRKGHAIFPVEWVLDPGGGGFGVRCECGWSSKLYVARGLAEAAGERHVAAREVSEAADDRRQAKRRWRR